MSSIIALDGLVRIESSGLVRDTPAHASAKQREVQVGVGMRGCADRLCRLVDDKRVEYKLIGCEGARAIRMEEDFEAGARILGIDLAGGEVARSGGDRRVERVAQAGLDAVELRQIDGKPHRHRQYRSGRRRQQGEIATPVAAESAGRYLHRLVLPHISCLLRRRRSVPVRRSRCRKAARLCVPLHRIGLMGLSL